MALRLLNSTTRSGRKVTGGNVAFYIIKMLRSGRRSTGERRNDPMHLRRVERNLQRRVAGGADRFGRGR